MSRLGDRVVVTAAIVSGGLGLMALLERRRPLRRRVESQPVRTGRNAAIGATSLLVSIALQRAIGTPVLRRSVLRRSGLVRMLKLEGVPAAVVSIALLDYTLWIWHRANHRFPLLWRFHLVHHIDLDLDASTALRFHFGEMALSVLFRALQVALIGPADTALAIWQEALFASILFHHSNLDIPPDLERFLALVVVTPRMHGIHHSTRAEETNSNWSSLLSVWDRLHGTYRTDRFADAVIIGVPAWQDPAEVALGRMLALPFGEQRDDWSAQ
jgi:sterol desaturase/sphingolipid hydroxylase (fatty acid hydroxylase superfamily)